ncbi:hypothetical protein V0288_10960 [Pannus brasiliensis CCIBt3594]|uniref:Uncharacterized protein n=1 Tax=Pannus brasiliensis CCIBt3594 TaxID=1427578 RepID=A0AAW9QXT0_9CHRO
MFGKPPKEPKPPEVKDLPDVVFPIKQNSPTNESTIENEIVPVPQPEVVTVTEKISQILSPYFIVLVGLFLYDRNGFIGFILISAGVLSIFGFPWNNLPKFIEEIKKFFRSN